MDETKVKASADGNGAAGHQNGKVIESICRLLYKKFHLLCSMSARCDVADYNWKKRLLQTSPSPECVEVPNHFDNATPINVRAKSKFCTYETTVLFEN